MLRCPAKEAALLGLVFSSLEVRVVGTVMDALVVGLIELWEVAREL